MIHAILRLLAQEQTALTDLVHQLRRSRTAFAAARGDELARLSSGLQAMESPREAAAQELWTCLAELGRRLGLDPGRPPTLSRVLEALPPADRARLTRAAAAARKAAAAARLELAVGERLLQQATEAQEGFLRDLIGSLDGDIESAAMVDVKG